MDTGQHRHRWAVWICVFFAIMLIGYPLSIGPIAMIQKAINSPEFNRTIDPYFVPLRKLPPQLRGLLGKWARLWRGE